MMENELLTRQEVAAYLKVSLRTVDNFIHQKDFYGLVYIGKNVRIPKKYLLKYIEEHREQRG